MQKQTSGSLEAWAGLALLWLLTMLGGPAWGDEPDRPSFVSVGAAAIPRAVVAALAQDKAGLLWIATGDGLVRYDGYRFQPRGREGAAPLRQNLGWVRALLATRDGRVWIGTEADGLAVYDPDTDRLEDWPAARDGADDNPAVRLNITIRALAEGSDGTVWVGSQGAGLLRIGPGAQPPRLYRQGPGSLPDDRVLSLLVDSQGTLWVGTWQGLLRLPQGAEIFEAVLSGGVVQALFQASDGSIWAGAQDGRLWRIDPLGGAPSLQAGALPGRVAVTSLAEAPLGRLWVGRTEGVDLHDLASGQLLEALRVDLRRPGSLLGKEVTALLRDRAGSVWVGSLGGGLQRHDAPLPGLRLLVPATEASPSVRYLLARADGSLWAAAEEGGLWRFDAKLQPLGAWQPPGIGAQRVQAMAESPAGGTWLAGPEALYRLDAQGRLLQRLPHGVGLVFRLLLDPQGRLWVCAEGGLYSLAPGRQQLERAGAAGGSVFTAALAPDGSVWFGGSDGLLRAAPASTAVQPVAQAADAGLGNPVVIGLLFDREGRLWVDTAIAGLHRAIAAEAGQPLRFERISERHGALGKPFGANLLQDSAGRIWTQLHVYDPASDRLYELGESDGAQLGTGWFHAYAQLPDGRRVFGGSRGMLLVQGEAFAPAVQEPPLVLTGLLINGQRQPAPVRLQQLALVPAQRSFAVEFAALDYVRPLGVRYAWMLEGFDRDWTLGGADLRLASYSNLDPGSYRLRVRTLGRDGVPAVPELSLAVQVLPAWWQRREAQALAALIPLLLAWAWLRQRSRAWQRQRAELEDLVAQRTAALELSALTDPLTGLRNRRYVSQQLPAEAARCLRRHEMLATQAGHTPDEVSDVLLFLIDIDHFKGVNDHHGHAAGDAVLVQLAARLNQAFREGDAVVRWGGEEFLVLARDTARSRAAELAERVRGLISSAPFQLPGGQALHCTCSVGFAVYPLAPQWPAALEWTEVLKLADDALYAVKTNGRNGWLGLTSASAESPEALRTAATWPLARWQAAGSLVLQGSTGVSAALPS